MWADFLSHFQDETGGDAGQYEGDFVGDDAEVEQNEQAQQIQEKEERLKPQEIEELNAKLEASKIEEDSRGDGGSGGIGAGLDHEEEEIPKNVFTAIPKEEL